MKKFIFALCLSGLLFPAPLVRAQDDPGAQQDAEAAREKLLKAADQLDLLESNSEANKTELDGLQADLKKLEDQNAALTQQVATLQDQLQKMEADRATERQVLLEEVAKMIAAGKTARVSHHHDEATTASDSSGPAAETAAVGANDPAAATPKTGSVVMPDTAAPADTPPTDAAPGGDTAATAPAAPAHVEKGYYHIVARHETLSMIAAAYRAQGVKVTTAQIRRANGLSEKAVLKVGEKLFIPKPESST